MKPPKPEPLPDFPAPYCDTYRYQLDNEGIVTFWFGRGGQWYGAGAISLGLAINLHQQLGNTIAERMKPQQLSDTSAAAIDKVVPFKNGEPKS